MTTDLAKKLACIALMFGSSLSAQGYDFDELNKPKSSPPSISIGQIVSDSQPEASRLHDEIKERVKQRWAKLLAPLGESVNVLLRTSGRMVYARLTNVDEFGKETSFPTHVSPGYLDSKNHETLSKSGAGFTMIMPSSNGGVAGRYRLFVSFDETHWFSDDENFTASALLDVKAGTRSIFIFISGSSSTQSVHFEINSKS